MRIALPSPDRPRASVIIPAWRRADLLRRCLESLASHLCHQASFETVIMVNGATPDVVSLVRDDVEGARVVTSQVNLGFGRGCNRAARKATGEFLVFLNDDTQVQDDWLDALVRTADAHPEAGAVGSRIVSHDGLLLEAGGLVWREGVSSHVGRGLPESTKQHRFVRRADYCSASSLLVRRTTWDAVGGFDEGYFPGYYEDVDLCLSIGRLGQEILFEPRSCVRHYESGSLEWDSPYKDFVASRSQARFISKWSADLNRFPALPESEDPWDRLVVDERALLAARRAHLRVLIVDGGARDRSDTSPGLAAAVEDLAGRRVAISVFVGEAADPDGYFADVGVEVVDGDLLSHLAGPVTYEAVLFRQGADFQAFAQALRALQPLAAVLYETEDAASDVLKLPEDAKSLAGSPLIRADHIVCRSAIDASLLGLLPRRAPMSRSVGMALTGARRDVVRLRSRLCGGRQP